MNEYEVVVRDANTGLLRRDGLKYRGRSAEREAKRLTKLGTEAHVLPYRPLTSRQVMSHAC